VDTNSKKLKSNFKTASPFLGRLAVFLVCFIIASGIIGPKIISHGLVGKDGFQIYGSAGKALLFGSVAIVILIWRNRPLPKLNKWHRANAIWLITAAIAVFAEWEILDKIIEFKSPDLALQILAHAFIILAVISSLIFSFGSKNIRILGLKYRNELAIAAGLSFLFICFVNIVYDIWNLLASTVLTAVKDLLDLVGIHGAYVPPHTLVFTKFGINLIQACSGVDSIALFTALYVLFGVIDWRRFDHRKFISIFMPALILLVGVNVLRVFTLIMAGYYINPQIAFSLFHTYAGMLFFILYSIIFWAITYNWMLRKTQKDL
jgi:exosortase/archaeosortase family protein